MTLLVCFVWAMVVIGISFAMVERGVQHWWLSLVFGLLVLAIALVAGFAVAYRLPGHLPGAVGSSVAPPAPSDSGTTASMPTRSDPDASVTPRLLMEPLSKRELEVLEHLAAGRSNREIAAALYVAPGTVKAHLNHIFRKLEASSRLQAVAHARQAGLLDAPGPQ